MVNIYVLDLLYYFLFCYRAPAKDNRSLGEVGAVFFFLLDRGDDHLDDQMSAVFKPCWLMISD